MAKYLDEVASGRKNNFTVVRFICACFVIYGHSYAVTKAGGGDWVSVLTGYAFSGGVAVDIFFIISGFLVSASIINGGVFHYIMARALRIYPALIVNMLLAVFVMGTIVTTLSISDYLSNKAVWGYFFDLASTTKGGFFVPGVFTQNPDHAINGAIWSVLIEVRLYLILAVIYLFGFLKNAARFNILFFCMIIVFWMCPTWLPEFASNRTASHVVFLFFVGVFLYINRANVPVGAYSLLVAFILCAMTLGTPGFPFAYILFLIAVFLAVCFGSQFSWIDKYGDFSYGIYLYGWPVQQMVVSARPNVSAHANAIISVLIAFVISYFSWHFIESPALRWKKKLDFIFNKNTRTL